VLYVVFCALYLGNYLLQISS